MIYQLTGKTKKSELTGEPLYQTFISSSGEIRGWVWGLEAIEQSSGSAPFLGPDCVIEGGGRIAKNARAEDQAVIGPYSLVTDDARIYDKAVAWQNIVLGGSAHISGNARVSASVKGSVYGNARVGQDVDISGGVDFRIGGNAKLWERVKAEGSFVVDGDTKAWGDVRIRGGHITGGVRLKGTQVIAEGLWDKGEHDGRSTSTEDVFKAEKKEITGPKRLRGRPPKAILSPNHEVESMSKKEIVLRREHGYDESSAVEVGQEGLVGQKGLAFPPGESRSIALDSKDTKYSLNHRLIKRLLEFIESTKNFIRGGFIEDFRNISLTPPARVLDEGVIDDFAYAGKGTVVKGRGYLTNNASAFASVIEGKALVKNNAKLTKVLIGGNAIVEDEAKIVDSSIRDSARVGGRAIISRSNLFDETDIVGDVRIDRCEFRGKVVVRGNVAMKGCDLQGLIRLDGNARVEDCSIISNSVPLIIRGNVHLVGYRLNLTSRDTEQLIIDDENTIDELMRP